MVIINVKGEITSYRTWAIIEPNWKYLESNFLYPLTNFFVGNTGDDTGKWKEAKNMLKKRPLLMGSFMALINQVFPCFHCISKTSPSHINYVIKIFFVEGLNGMLLNCHMCQFTIFGHKEKTLMQRKRCLLSRDYCLKSFLICKTYLGRI